MFYAIRIFQVVVIICLVLSIFKTILKAKSRDDTWHYLTMSSWVYYFFLIGSFILSLGMYSYRGEKTDEVFWIFTVTVCVCVLIACAQKIWLIKYNENTLIFRNSFGITRKYDIKKLRLIAKDEKDELWYNDKKITEWPTLLMNIKEQIDFFIFIDGEITK